MSVVNVRVKVAGIRVSGLGGSLRKLKLKEQAFKQLGRVQPSPSNSHIRGPIKGYIYITILYLQSNCY